MLTASPRTIGARAFGVVLEHVLALPPAREVERDERRSRADALGHLRLDLDLRAGRRLHPHVFAVLHAAIVGVLGIDLDEVLLLQLGEPRVASASLRRRLRTRPGGRWSGSAGSSPRPCPRRSSAAPTCRASAAARTPSCRRGSDTSRRGPAAASTAARGAAGCRRGSSTRSRAPWRCRTDVQPCFISNALDAAGEVGLPVLAFGRLLLGVGEVVPPAELLQQHVVELGIAGGELGALGIRAVLGQQIDAVALDAEVGAEAAAAVHDARDPARRGSATPDA